MSPHFYFILIFLITITFTRLFLFFFPTPSPTIKQFRLHHYMYGSILILLGIILTDVTIFAIGMGLFVDELGFILIRGQNHADNYSLPSLALLVLFVFLTILSTDLLLFWY